MKKFIAAIAVLMTLTYTNASAQDYKAAIGVRGGVDMSGISGKINLDAINSVEALLDFDNGFNLVGLYEFNRQIARDFTFYYGLGANLGVWGSADQLTIGVDAIVGVEYVIPNVPFALSIDYKPFVNLVGVTGFRATDFGLGIKYIF